MRKTITKRIRDYASSTLPRIRGCTYKQYLRDLKKHYKLTGSIGFSLVERGVSWKAG